VTTRRTTIALYGAGMISAAHAGAARLLGLNVIGVASRTAERTASRAGELGTRPMTYAELPAGADIVVVSTPPQCHADDAIGLLRTGAAVVLEKPLCTTLEQADRLLEAAAQHRQRILYAENLAYAPCVRALLTMAGRLDPPTHIEVRTIQPLPTWGNFTSDEWGGGALFDLGAHPIALAVLLAAPAKIVAVSATLEGGPGHNSDVYADVSLHFDNGLTARVVSSWKSAGDQIWDVQFSTPTDVLRLEIFPELSLEHNGDPIAIPSVTSGPYLEPLGYAGQLGAFVSDLQSGETPMMSVAFGHHVLHILLAAYQSAGRRGALEAVPFTGRRDRTPLQLWHDPV
jgi:myo-inositol 2-dehydrogenase / D-chiro-inositol 1-dehydrogenase